MNNQSGSLAGKYQFNWMEFSGSLGDLGLFLPLVVAMTISCNLNIGVVLILAGFMNIFTGWLFRQPIPVQPMKAIAAVVITEGLTHDQLLAAGIIIGVFLIIISGMCDQINRFIPKSVVRGIQLGVGLKLAVKGVQWIGELPIVGLDSVFIAIGIICLLLVVSGLRQPSLLYVFLIGFVILYYKQPDIYSTIQFSVPNIHWYWPSNSAWKGGLVNGTLAQLPLTVLNSVIALCALSSQYFPGRGVKPYKVAMSIGWMNLLCVPLGGIPMCHGSGGLAAQYRFGARTGGSVIMLGFLKIVIGVLFGGALLGLLQNYPMSILGPMLILAGIKLAQSSKDIIGDRKGIGVAIVTALFILIINTGAGFLAGMGISFLYSMQTWRKKCQ